ncbi:hypothetical protein [Clostridium tunisiense]|uniref:hypothetical protein n=1 Tax=Clostridium tunisiense TaxID=219748 RepID=UPI0002F404EB|nr:hypothetical protein [Clostridium tunisiense]
MLDIQVRRIDKYYCDLTVNGITDYRCFQNDRYYNVDNDKVIPELMKASFSEIKSYFDDIIFKIGCDNYDEFYEIEVRLKLNGGYKSKNKCPYISFCLRMDWELWNKPWSIADFAESFKRYTKDLNCKELEYYQDDEAVCNGFGVLFYLEEHENLFKNEFTKCNETFKKVLDEVYSKVILEVNKSSHTEIFQFPSEIEPICKQYLVYFTQFLKDIGIEADSELKNESGKLLFSVTPTDKSEGLERIKEALNCYLNLPTSKEFELYGSNEIAVQQLQANIMHLKSQLMLARSAIQYKDMTIESLQLLNYKYNALIECENNSEDETRILNDIITVKPYEFNGGSINLPKLLKILKRNR